MHNTTQANLSLHPQLNTSLLQSYHYINSLCRTIFDEGQLLEFAKLGSYLEYDLFGMETLNYAYDPTVDMPSDSQRVKT